MLCPLQLRSSDVNPLGFTVREPATQRFPGPNNLHKIVGGSGVLNNRETPFMLER